MPKAQARRYNKSYPSDRTHVDTKRLPLRKGQKITERRDGLFVVIDDYSRGLYAAILPDKSADSAAKFLCEQVIEPCPHLMENIYSDNGTEYRSSLGHRFVKACTEPSRQVQIQIHQAGTAADQWQGGSGHPQLDGDMA